MPQRHQVVTRAAGLRLTRAYEWDETPGRRNRRCHAGRRRVIKESIGAFPRVVLAEGDYHVIARNEGKTFQRDFKVITGVDGEVEVLAR